MKILTAVVMTLAVVFPAHSTPASNSVPKPTIVLVHGAWADASGWNNVAERLQERGFTVLAPANPLRGLLTDAAYLATLLATIAGPIVLVGHSYGGMVMTNAANGNLNIEALVYVAAFAPDVGDTVATLGLMNPGSKLGPATLLLRPHPAGVDAYIAPAAFRDVFAADLPRRLTTVMAAGQRPIDAAALAQPSGPPAWRTIPSWYLVASADNAIPPVTERFMATRAGAVTSEVTASHAVLVSKPDVVTDVILRAVSATSTAAA